MKPFCNATLGAILGIIMGLYFKSMALFVFIIIIIGIVIFKKYIKQLIVFTICFILLFTYTCILENKYENIYKQYNNRTIKIYGQVVSSAKENEYYTTYKIKITKVQVIETNEIIKEKFNVLCSIKNNEGKVILRYGDIVTITGVFEKAKTQTNEGGFDYSSYLKTKQIAGTINVNRKDINIVENKTSIFSIISNLKENLIQNVKQILPSEEGLLCISLLLGEKGELSEDIQKSFRKSSLSHMLAISGAHLSYILLGITNFFSFLKFHKRWGNIFVIVFLIFFMVLTGLTPSVTRACIMCILNLLANILFKKSNIYNNLAISSFIILLFNPYALLDIGFQLSFGGTIGIVIFSSKMTKKKNSEKEQNKSEEIKVVKILFYKILNSIKQMAIVSLAANIIILPIMIYYFNTLSLSFIISNILASYILGFCLKLGMVFIILSFTPIAKLISYFLKPILQLLIFIADISSKLSFSQILIPTPKIWQIIIYYILILFLFYKKQINTYILAHLSNKKIYKITILILVFIIISPYIFSVIPQNKLKINFVDVDQGDCTLITTPQNKTILIDGGGNENFNVGERTLLPYLLDKGILKIDYIIISHFDTDHVRTGFYM